MRPHDPAALGRRQPPPIDMPHRDGVGLQGAALILELERLRAAFEQEGFGDPPPRQVRRAAGGSTRPPGRVPPQRPPRRKKGQIRRALDLCLEQFGLNAAVPRAPDRPPQRPRAPQRPTSAARPPDIIRLDPLPMHRQREEVAVPIDRDQRPQAPIEIAPLVLPAPAPRPATTVGRMIDIGRNGVMAGFAFLVQRDGLADNDNAPDESLTLRAGRSFERELRSGLRVLLVAMLLGGGWLVLMPLAGAVVVPGSLVVQSSVKSIQHPTGGIVAEIPVHNGMRVNAGDLLMRLDATQAQASLQVVSKQLDELRARISRLTAERDGLDQLEMPAELATRSGEAAVGRLLASEQSLFKARTSARRSQRDLLQSRVAQLGEEISGLEAQVDSKAKQLELIGGELGGVQDLYDKRLVPLTRLTTLQRESARIEGERGQLTSAIAETKAKIGEAQLQIVRLDQDFRTDVVKELGENRAKEAELTERGIAAQDMLDRIELRAPTPGVIHQLSVHTIGGVVRAGDVLMEVVPDSDDLLIEARLQPNDIDQVRAGQNAFVRFPAFNQRVTPQVTGTVSYVSADTSHDQQSNAPFYSVRVTLPEDERHRLAGQQLVSGMPAEVFLQTGSRTMMSYLLKPITDQLSRAFVER